MLGGLDPVIIFEFSTKIDRTPTGVDGKIPVAGQRTFEFIPLPPIPIYLSENLTGLFIDKEDKNIDIGTDTETFYNTAAVIAAGGSSTDIVQKGVASGVKITLSCKKDSIAMMLMSAVIDQIYDKVTSKAYSITYLHGATTIFRGVMHSFSVSQDSQTDKMEVNIELSRGAKQPTPSNAPVTVPASGVAAIPVGAA